MSYLFMILLFVTALFLIVLVLIQRGKGGGLAGAFGGLGGQSAFGTKAGDLFTRVTIGVATVWILLCIGAVKYFGAGDQRLGPGFGSKSAPKEGVSAPASTEKQPGGAQPVQPAPEDEPSN